MFTFLVAAAVAVFAFLFAWGDLLGELAGPRTRRLLGLVGVSSMYMAFRFAPGAATEIVLRPMKPIADWITTTLERSFSQDPKPPSTTSP